MLIAPKSRLVMTGDSITDAGRQPSGEGLFEAIGKGYVALVDALLNSAWPELKIRVVNRGNSGNTVRDLAARWDHDVLALQPNWLSIMIGINDVWRQFDQPHMTHTHVYPEEYRATLDKIAAQARPRVQGLVLMTPYYLEPHPQDAMRKRMDEYGQIVKELARRHDALFVDVQAAFAPVLAEYYPATLGWDRIHPNQIGHMTIARAFLKAIGFEWR
jgi:lysophospholipase L1-like esterase